MVKIKSQAEIDANYRAGIGRAPENYKKGIQGTNDWQEKASSESAEANYAAGVQEAAATKRRQKAVSNVSNEEWKQAAADKGASRIGPGMQAGAGKRTQNFEPYRSAIEGVALPDRTTDPISNVDNRVKPIVQALVDTKKAIKG
ncbi:hypothetical protein LCGC14_2166720 [marine sediment metagenome]|uniref:Uncharacterized protein n=1 Tax=marine sediment metagenome TaxID=412755 RepID=A0A0F9DRC1_9ZZZZ